MGLKVAAQADPVFKVLLIDDDISQHNLIRIALKNDFVLVSEMSGAQAVQTALKEKPQLILLDLHMPHVDGFEVLEQLKRNPALSSIPIFCLSATTDEDSRSRSTRLGASSFISKPVQIKTLAQDIKNNLENLNSSLVSEDGKTAVFVGMNEDEMRKWFQQKLSATCGAGQKIITLSVREGAFFINEQLSALVIDEKVVFMQIKPSLLNRLPFLDDLAPVTDDLCELLDAPADSYVLIIERPELFLLSPAIDNKTAAILAFRDAFESKFFEVNYLCKKPGTVFELSGLNEMVKLLAHQY